MFLCRHFVVHKPRTNPWILSLFGLSEHGPVSIACLASESPDNNNLLTAVEANNVHLLFRYVCTQYSFCLAGNFLATADILVDDRSTKVA